MTCRLPSLDMLGIAHMSCYPEKQRSSNICRVSAFACLYRVLAELFFRKPFLDFA